MPFPSQYNHAMKLLGPSLAIGCVLFVGTGVATGQLRPGYDPVEQTIGDINPLSRSLRRLHPGLGRPTGFGDVYRVPGEDGKLMRIHGGIHAVFPQSLYGINEDDELEAFIPPNTVFRIGPRFVDERGMVLPSNVIAGLDVPGLANPDEAAADPRGQQQFRIMPRTQDAQVVMPQSPQQQALHSNDQPRIPLRPRPMAEGIQENTAEVQPLNVPGTIIGDEAYRRARMRELMQTAAANE